MATQLGDQFLYQSSLKAEPDIKVSTQKRVPMVIDINQGSYQNGVITIDATSQLNGAEGFAALRDAYVMLPYKVSMKNTHGSQALAAAANRLSVGLKCGVWNVIDSMSLELNGKQILSMLDYKNFINNVRAQTEFSSNYVDKHGSESFVYPDESGSLVWSASATTNGDGYSNNTANIAANPDTSGVLPANSGFVKRLLSNPPESGSVNTFGWPTLKSGSATNISNQLGRGAFKAGAATTPAGSIAGTWFYMLKIRLVDLHPIFEQLDLMGNPQIKLRFRVNQGSSVISCPYTGSAKVMSLTSTTLASGNTCPIMVSSATTGSPNSGVLPAAAGEITVAWGAITNSLEPTIDGTYWPFTTTRLYVPFFNLENPQALISKPEKKIKYLDFYAQWFYQRAGVGITGGTQHNTAFDLQLSASLKNAKYVCLMPFAETSSGNFASATVQQFQSPFDSAPWTVQAGSCIRNFNVRVGSTQVFDLNYDYDWHSFCNEFSKLGAINGDLSEELSNGLIDLKTWSLTNRVMIADISRLTEPTVPQSIQVMGTNASSQGVNLLVLVAFENELTYNRLTGEVVDYTAS
jgi:hypothetical protein